MSLKELAPTYFTRLYTVIEEVGRPKRMLNAGCGDGVYDLYLKHNVSEIISMDINEADIRMARLLNPEKNLLYCVGDMGAMPFASGSFDCAICADVIEHLQDDVGAIREMCRCLKKGGKLIMTAPSKNFPFFYDPLNYVLNKFGKKWRIGIWGWGHKRLYTAREIQRKTGLTLITTAYLSKSLVGLMENSYLNSFLQKFTKNDPCNRGSIGKHVNRTAKTVKFEIPPVLKVVRDVIMSLDRVICRSSKKSVGILAVFRK